MDTYVRAKDFRSRGGRNASCSYVRGITTFESYRLYTSPTSFMPEQPRGWWASLADSLVSSVAFATSDLQNLQETRNATSCSVSLQHSGRNVWLGRSNHVDIRSRSSVLEPVSWRSRADNPNPFAYEGNVCRPMRPLIPALEQQSHAEVASCARAHATFRTIESACESAIAQRPTSRKIMCQWQRRVVLPDDDNTSLISPCVHHENGCVPDSVI